MKIFRILKTNISDSFKGVFRNFSLSLASISCITITLLIVGLSMLLSVNVNNLTEEIEKDMTIVVFLDRQLDQENITIVSEQINKLDNILESKFNSKNQVKEEMQGESEVFNSILAQYTDETNPLQDTFLVKVDDINKIGETADKIKKIEHVDLVKYGEGSVEDHIFCIKADYIESSHANNTGLAKMVNEGKLEKTGLGKNTSYIIKL